MRSVNSAALGDLPPGRQRRLVSVPVRRFGRVLPVCGAGAGAGSGAGPRCRQPGAAGLAPPCSASLGWLEGAQGRAIPGAAGALFLLPIPPAPCFSVVPHGEGLSARAPLPVPRGCGQGRGRERWLRGSDVRSKPVPFGGCSSRAPRQVPRARQKRSDVE